MFLAVYDSLLITFRKIAADLRYNGGINAAMDSDGQFYSRLIRLVSATLLQLDLSCLVLRVVVTSLATVLFLRGFFLAFLAYVFVDDICLDPWRCAEGETNSKGYGKSSKVNKRKGLSTNLLNILWVI